MFDRNERKSYRTRIMMYKDTKILKIQLCIFFSLSTILLLIQWLFTSQNVTQWTLGALVHRV